MRDFRQGVLDVAGKGLEIVEKVFDGGEVNKDLLDKAATMIREGVKVSNRDQMDMQVKRSQAIRLISFIPAEKRGEYIAQTNPETKPFLLLGRPKK